MSKTYSESEVTHASMVALVIGIVIGIGGGIIFGANNLNTVNTLVPKDSELHKEICVFIDSQYSNRSLVWFEKVRALNCEKDLGIKP